MTDDQTQIRLSDFLWGIGIDARFGESHSQAPDSRLQAPAPGDQFFPHWFQCASGPVVAGWCGSGLGRFCCREWLGFVQLSKLADCGGNGRGTDLSGPDDLYPACGASHDSIFLEVPQSTPFRSGFGCVFRVSFSSAGDSRLHDLQDGAGGGIGAFGHDRSGVRGHSQRNGAVQPLQYQVTAGAGPRPAVATRDAGYAPDSPFG